jgi:hypothetical protein
MSHQLFLFLLITNASAVACISLQYPAYSYISISHISLLSHNQHHYSRLNHLTIHFVDNEFEKTIA